MANKWLRRNVVNDLRQADATFFGYAGLKIEVAVNHMLSLYVDWPTIYQQDDAICISVIKDFLRQKYGEPTMVPNILPYDEVVTGSIQYVILDKNCRFLSSKDSLDLYTVMNWQDAMRFATPEDANSYLVAIPSVAMTNGLHTRGIIDGFLC